MTFFRDGAAREAWSPGCIRFPRNIDTSTVRYRSDTWPAKERSRMWAGRRAACLVSSCAHCLALDHDAADAQSFFLQVPPEQSHVLHIGAEQDVKCVADHGD